LRAAAYLVILKAVVSRGGRPDLALSALDQVTAPTLLIVGGMDMPVIEMNKTAYDELHYKRDENYYRSKPSV
jgi:hypothetical protein